MLLTTSRKLDCFSRMGKKKKNKNSRDLKTSKRIMKSFTMYNCNNSNCVCQLLKQEATKSIQSNSSGCPYRSGIKNCSLSKNCLTTTHYLPPSVPPLSEYICISGQHAARHCSKNVLFSGFYALPVVISCIFRQPCK